MHCFMWFAVVIWFAGGNVVVAQLHCILAIMLSCCRAMLVHGHMWPGENLSARGYQDMAPHVSYDSQSTQGLPFC